MNKKNLFIISAPLQLLNAIEAKHYFKTTHNILVLMYNSELNEIDYNQKINLVETDEWEEIIYYDLAKIAKKKRFFEQVKLIKKLKKDTYEYLFPGDFGTIQQAIMANINTENIYLLDDGTASITIYDKIKDQLFFNKIPFSKKMKLLRYRLMNLKYEIKQDINFFTIYNLQSLEHRKVIQHDFSYIKQSRLQKCEKSSDIYILGQKLVEINWMNEEKYIEYLKKIIILMMDKHDGKIIYKPHRSEKITPAYACLINDRFSIDEHINEGPIETVLIDKNIYPAVIISFFSSALFTLDKIFDDTLIYAIRIKREDLIIEDKTVGLIDNCYTFFADTNVIIMDEI